MHGRSLRQAWVLATFMSVGLLGSSGLLAVEIKGKVLEVKEDIIKIRCDSEYLPAVGDKMVILVEVPGLDEPLPAGSAKVSEVGSDLIAAKIDPPVGNVVPDCLVRITSEKPRKREEKTADDRPDTAASSSAGQPVAPGAGPEWTNVIGIKFVLVRPGAFLMGSVAGEGHDNERPQHRVEISRPFYLAIHEVTQQQYERVMKRNPSWFSASGRGASRLGGGPSHDLPVESVSYDEALAFCAALDTLDGLPKGSYRLPTEAEWEYAARAGSTQSLGPAGDEHGLADSAWFASNSAARTHPVGSKRPNTWGLYDMQGNVWEWCADWYAGDYYAQRVPKDPVGPTASETGQRVLRGGAWISRSSPCRPADRNAAAPTERLNVFGFRVARTVRE